MPTKRRRSDDDDDDAYQPPDSMARPAKKSSNSQQPVKTTTKQNEKADSETDTITLRSAGAPQSTARNLQKGKGKSTYKDSKRKLQLQADDERKARQEAERKTAELQQQLNVIHESRLASSNQGKDYVQDDRKICDNVELLFKLVADWAGDWANNGFIAKYMRHEDILDLMAYLSGEGTEPALIILEDTVIAQDKFAWNPAGCQRTIEAIVSWYIIRRILKRPFHFLGLENQDHGFPSEISLQKLRQTMGGSCFDSKVWYSRTLRPHYRSLQYGGPIQDRIENDPFGECRKTFYETMISEFLDDPFAVFRPLLRDCDPDNVGERFEDLLNIFFVAGKLSLQLWLQDSAVKVMQRPLKGEDLNRALSTGECVSRGPLEPKVDGESRKVLLADMWIRLGFGIVRYEVDGKPKSLWAGPPMVLCTDDGKWKKNKQRFQDAEQRELTQQTSDSNDFVNDQSTLPALVEDKESSKQPVSTNQEETSSDQKCLNVYVDTKPSSEDNKHNSTHIASPLCYPSFTTYLPQSLFEDNKHNATHVTKPFSYPSFTTYLPQPSSEDNKHNSKNVAKSFSYPSFTTYLPQTFTQEITETQDHGEKVRSAGFYEDRTREKLPNSAGPNPVAPNAEQARTYVSELDKPHSRAVPNDDSLREPEPSRVLPYPTPPPPTAQDEQGYGQNGIEADGGYANETSVQPTHNNGDDDRQQQQEPQNGSLAATRVEQPTHIDLTDDEEDTHVRSADSSTRKAEFLGILNEKKLPKFCKSFVKGVSSLQIESTV